MKKLLMVSAMLLVSTTAIAQLPSLRIDSSSIVTAHDNVVACDDPTAVVMLSKGRAVLGDINFAHYVSQGRCIELPKGIPVYETTFAGYIEDVRIASITGLKVDTYNPRSGVMSTIDRDAIDIARHEALISYVRLSDLMYEKTGLPIK